MNFEDKKVLYLSTHISPDKSEGQFFFFFPIRALILTQKVYWDCTFSFVCRSELLKPEPKPHFQHGVL